MLFLIIVKTALRNLVAHKMRSFLTLLGIVIGVAAVVAMVALGAGTQDKVTESMRNFGANLVSIRPDYRAVAGGVRSGSYVGLKVADAEAVLRRVPEVEMVTPDLDGDFQIKYHGRNARVTVNGNAVTYFPMRNYEIGKGRTYTEDEVNRASRVVVLGPAIAEKLFGMEDPVGNDVKIKGINFRVIGVTRPKDERADENTWIPYTTAMAQLIGQDHLDQIYCKIRNGADINLAIEHITEVMRRQHRIQADAPSDFSIRNRQEVLDSMERVTQTFTFLLGGVAGIALLVGGVNIMNIMLVTVTERTREIGVRKALGARNTDVLAQFVLEALTVSVIGGALGVALGTGAVFVFNDVTARLSGEPFGARIEIWAVLAAFAVASAIGVFFGWYPARKAAQLDPIEALRYE
jgi:putative ABC transport system permease protein